MPRIYPKNSLNISIANFSCIRKKCSLKLNKQINVSKYTFSYRFLPKEVIIIIIFLLAQKLEKLNSENWVCVKGFFFFSQENYGMVNKFEKEKTFRG